MPRSARAGRPTVLFVDDQGWSSFDQVAAALRHRGVRAVRVTSAPAARLRDALREPHLRWLTDRTHYDAHIVLSRPGGERRLARLLDRGVADVVATEPALLRIGLASEVGRALAARAQAFTTTPPEVLLDKYAVNERLAAAGLATPTQIRCDALTPAQAVRRLGLPLVLKDRIGAGGDQVRIVRSLPALEGAIAELGGDTSTLFYQRYIPGRMVIYASIWDADGPRIEHGVVTGESQYPLGPSATIRLYDTPALLAAGRAAARALGCRGFASFGFMEAEDGQLFHVDANCRPWGMILAPLKAGIDVLSSYVRLVGGGRRFPALRPRDAGDELPVFPFCVYRAIRQGSLADARRCWREFLRTSRHAVGLTYCLHTGLRAALLVAGRMRREWRGRPAAPSFLAGPAVSRHLSPGEGGLP